MPGLAELQARFASALLDPDADELDTWVRTSHISPARRIAVYRNNSRISQLEALAGIYSAVQQLVGEQFFEELAVCFNSQHPSTSGDLREYGSALADFLADFEPVEQLTYLTDVARLEWAWHECFHAEAAIPVAASDLTALAASSENEARLSLVPATRLVASPYPIAAIWTFALDPERPQEGLDLDALGEAYLLIARTADTVNVMELTPAQYLWLSLIDEGATLGDSFEQTLQSFPEFDLANELAHFVRLGILTKDKGERK